MDAGSMGCAHRAGMGSETVVVGSPEHDALLAADTAERVENGDFSADAGSNCLTRKRNVLLSTKESQNA